MTNDSAPSSIQVKDGALARRMAARVQADGRVSHEGQLRVAKLLEVPANQPTN